MSKTTPTLGYYDTRGLAQSIRLLLKYAGVEFNDKRYPFGPGTTLAEVESIRKYWLVDKFNLGLDFPNVPYYIDGDVKLTQSLAIMRYLGRKYGLFANDEKSLARQDLVEQQLVDTRVVLGPVVMNKDEFENNKKKLLNETLPQHLELFSKFLGKNEWLANKLTYVDFIAYDMLDVFTSFSPTCLDKWQNLQQFKKRFESLPPIAAYMKSKEFKSWPITGPYAAWGYSK